jgi:dolichol kinase
VAEPVDKSISVRGETYRKLTHLFALVIPVCYYIFGWSRTTMLLILVPVTIVVILMDISRLKGWRFYNLFRWMVSKMVRNNEQKGDFTGAFYILIASCIAIAIFSKPIALAALTFIIIGDPAAVLVGRNFGRHRFCGQKTIEGSLAFLVATIPVGLLAPDLPTAVGLTGAFVATITEGLSGSIDDNMSVPLISGTVMHIMLKAGLF